MIKIHHGEFDVLDLIICCPGKDQQLNHRHDKDYPEYSGVTKYLAKLLA
jgi:hypothetical protein